MDTKLLTKDAVAGMIDHTNLKATATREDIRKLCEEAKTYRFASVMVNSAFTALCKELVQGTGVLVGTVAGFPLGQMSTAAKVFEAETAIADGADEIDYVVNVSDVKDVFTFLAGSLSDTGAGASPYSLRRRGGTFYRL